MEEDGDLNSTRFYTSGLDDDYEWVDEEVRIEKADVPCKRFMFEEYP